MENFSEFVRGFCVIAVSGGLILLMSPNGSMKKYVKFIVSICMVSALLSAFFTFSEDAEKLFSQIETETESEAGKTQEELRAGVVKETKRNMEAELCALLSAHTGLPKEDIYIVMGIDSSNFAAVEIKEINVFIADSAQAERARAYISEMFMGAVTVNVMQKGE